MEDKIRCQSCGMPLGTPGGYGTNTDGSENKEYCKFCFQNGSFTNPDQTLEEMIASSVAFMSEELHFPKEKAERMSNDIIPNLKRWK